MISNFAFQVTEKSEQAATIQEEIRVFLTAGGEIQVIPHGVTSDSIREAAALRRTEHGRHIPETTSVNL